MCSSGQVFAKRNIAAKPRNQIVSQTYNNIASWHVPALILLYVLLIPLGESSLAVMLFFALGGIFLLFRDGKQLYAQYRDWIYMTLALSIPIAVALFTAIRFDKTLISFLIFILHGFSGIYVFHWCKKYWRPYFILYGIVAILVFWMATALPNLIHGNLLMLWQEWIGELTGYYSSNRNPGALLAHFSPLYFEALYRASLKLKNRLPWLLIIPYLLVIFLAGNRTGWMIISLVTIIFFIRLILIHHFTLRSTLFVTGLAAITLLVSFHTFPHFEQRLNRSLGAFQGTPQAIDQASAGRLQIWQGGLPLVQDSLFHPIGTHAFGQIGYEKGYHSREWGYAHIYWMDVVVSTGLLGLVLYLGVFMYLAHKLFASLSRNNFSFAMLLLAFALLLPINPNWEFYAPRVASLIWFTLILGFTYAYMDSNIGQSLNRPEDSSARAGRSGSQVDPV